MFPMKRIEQLYQELNHYRLQIIAFQDKDIQYQNIITKFSKIASELEDVTEDMRKYNNNNNEQIINLNKWIKFAIDLFLKYKLDRKSDIQ